MLHKYLVCSLTEQLRLCHAAAADVHHDALLHTAQPVSRERHFYHLLSKACKILGEELQVSCLLFPRVHEICIQPQEWRNALPASCTLECTFLSSRALERIRAYLWPLTTNAVLSRWDIFVAIAKNTLYGSNLYIFLLCQKSLGY